MAELEPTTSAAPEEAAAKVARQAEERILAAGGEIRRLWVVLAEELYAFTEAKMWADLGYETLEQWMASPHVDISGRQMFYLRESWRELVVKRGVDPEALARVGKGKVLEILPAVRRGLVDADEAFADAESMGRDDLRRAYSEAGARGATGPNATPHSDPIDPGTEPAWAICHACGSRYQVKEAA